MTLRVHIPSVPLRDFISAFIYVDSADPVHLMDRFLPDGNTELIFNLSDTPQYMYDNETLQEIQTCRRAWASGVRTQPITIPSGKGSRMLIVAFKKGKAYPFYPMPMSEIVDWVVEAEDVFGQRLLELREQLLASDSIDQMFARVEAFLFRQAGNALCSDIPARCIEYALSKMISQPNRLGSQQLCDEIGYSQKHFIDMFKQQVGTSPKQYMKIMRFQKVILELEKDQPAHWSQIALRNGYYDQSHFIHEFRSFSGFTPVEYLRRKSGTLNYVPVQ